MLKLVGQVFVAAVIVVSFLVTAVVVTTIAIAYAIYRHYHPRVALPPAESVHRLILVDGRDQ
jgi:hypothetical protein